MDKNAAKHSLLRRKQCPDADHVLRELGQGESTDIQIWLGNEKDAFNISLISALGCLLVLILVIALIQDLCRAPSIITRPP